MNTSLIIAAALSLGSNNLSLDGTWKFKLLPKSEPTAECAGWERSDYADTAWDDIRVPGNWEMQGFSSPVYGEKANNEFGLYRTTFTIPDAWAGQDVFVQTDGVQFGYRLWVDGAFVGEWTSSFNRKVWQVTLGPGAHTLAIQTLNRPKGWGFDTNDDWTLSGIFRSVTVFARPKVRLEDYTLTTQVAEEGSARVAVRATVKGSAATVTIALAGQESSAAVADGQAEMTLTLGKVPLWTAETPNLHTMTLTLMDAEGRVLDTVTEEIGLREVAWKDGVLKINNQPVKLRGVNHHDLSPDNGRAMTAAEFEADVKMMKAGNINFVRMCHYPPATVMLDLCDRYGLYVLDEVPFGFGSKNLSDESYLDVLKKRAAATIARDKNRTCVIAWSVGNENPLTPICEKTGEYVASLDATRPYCFPQIPSRFKDMLTNGVPETVGMLDWHYPSAEGLDEFSPLFQKPFIASEFAHALGLAYAGLEPVWEKMQTTPSIAGGAVWMFQDQGIRRKADLKKAKADDTGTWLDAETLLDTNGKAGTDGIVYSDRTPQTDYYETKAVYAPVRLDEKVLKAEAGKRKYRIPVENRYDFLNLSAVTCAWRLMADAKVLDQGTVKVDCAPQAKAEVEVRTTMPAERPAVSYRLELSFVDAQGNTVAAKTYPIVTDVEKLVTRQDAASPNVFSSECVLARVSRRETMNIHATRTTPRAVSKEHTIWTPHVLMPSNVVAGTDSAWSATFTPNPLPPNPPRKDGKKPKPVKELGNLAGTFTFKHGLCSYELKPSKEWETVEAGVSLMLPTMRRVRWLGDGPYEAYPQASMLDTFGVWALDVRDLYFMGNRPNVRAAVVDDGKGNGFLVLPKPGAEAMNLAFERLPEGGILLSHNAVVSGTFSKYVWPTDIRKVAAGETLKDAFRLIPLTPETWNEALTALFGAPDKEIKPFVPFVRSYDQ